LIVKQLGMEQIGVSTSGFFISDIAHLSRRCTN